MSTVDATPESTADALPPALTALLEGRLARPFSVLGLAGAGNEDLVRAHLPGARAVRVTETGTRLAPLAGTALFEGRAPRGRIPRPYRLAWEDAAGATHEAWDPYAFLPAIPEEDLARFVSGRHRRAYRILGAHCDRIQGVAGVRFAVWAPNAARVSVVGDFNDWDGRRHPLELRRGTGIWELFVPEASPGMRYQYELRNAQTGAVVLRADPCGRRLDPLTGNTSVVAAPSSHQWRDAEWLTARAERDWLHAPMSIYEVHLTGWRQRGAQALSYRELAVELVDHVAGLGFTHLEILAPPGPEGRAWSCRDPAYFAPADPLGAPDDLRELVDACHQRGIGVLLDWTPARLHEGGPLSAFDGGCAYESAAAGPGARRFDFARPEVRSFLVSSAVHWIEEYHVDGLRIGGVGRMLYRDGPASGQGAWPGQDPPAGEEDLDAVGLLRDLNEATQAPHPGVLMVAADSGVWPQVTRPPWAGGLGFSMKWNQGWAHEALEYISHAPHQRHAHHDMLTLGLLSAFTENFVLPFSHQEAAGASLLAGMPGDRRQQLASLRLLYTYAWSHPGKKLLFMGDELASPEPWAPGAAVPWELARDPGHGGMQALVRDLNRLHRELPALHGRDFDHSGFEWIDCHDAARAVLAYVRRSDNDLVVAALNFSDEVLGGYRIGVPVKGDWREILNSDSEYYGGGNVGNGGNLVARPLPWAGRPYSLDIVLPPLAGVLLRPVAGGGA